MADLLPPLRPIPIKERLSVLYIESGQLDVLDGAFVFPAHAGMNRRRARHLPGKAPNAPVPCPFQVGNPGMNTPGN
ncbi:MAG: hypothetical protein WBN82_04125 [Porticoccaceae bacterium]